MNDSMLKKTNKELIETLRQVKVLLDCYEQSGFWLDDEPPNAMVDDILSKIDADEEIS